MLTKPRRSPEHRARPGQQAAQREVPKHFAKDYQEARLILGVSPRASAALSRRCLQRLLREKAGVEPSDLSREIDHVLMSGAYPPALACALNTVRSLGKFLTRPEKSSAAGMIVHVEPGEAEWLLIALGGLLTHYFGPVTPEQPEPNDDAESATPRSVNGAA
jgi:uncharacterized protein DUF4145